MKLNKDYLKQIWDSVLEEGKSELDIQKRYFNKLNQILKGEDRYFLETLQRKIQELEIKVTFEGYLGGAINPKDKNENLAESESPRNEGDGTEWVIDKDENGNLFKRAIGSKEKIYINRNPDKK